MRKHFHVPKDLLDRMASSKQSCPKLMRRVLKLGLLLLSLELTSCLFIQCYPPSDFGYNPPRFETLSPEQQDFVGLVLAQPDNTSYITHDSHLGWTLQPSTSLNPETHSNQQGARSDHDYPLTRDGNTVRILAFGDSFTHGDEVGNDSTWTRKLEKSEPNLEVVNFGVPAYGLDQSLLRYRKVGQEFRPDFVIIGYLPEDLYRHVNVFRTFYLPQGSMALAKPRFELVDDKLELLPNPLPSPSDYEALLSTPNEILPRLGRKDAFYQHYNTREFLTGSAFLQLLLICEEKLFLVLGMHENRLPRRGNGPYNTDSESFLITLRVLSTFCEEVRQAGAVPIILITPSAQDYWRSDSEITYRPLLDQLMERGELVWDGREALKNQTEIFAKHGHYNEKGNELLALWLHAKCVDLLNSSKL